MKSHLGGILQPSFFAANPRQYNTMDSHHFAAWYDLFYFPGIFLVSFSLQKKKYEREKIMVTLNEACDHLEKT